MLENARLLFRQKLFWLGLILRLVCIPFFAGPILRDLFIPFLDFAVQNPLSNPWAMAPAHYFPYGAVQYALLFIPKFLAFLFFGPAALGSSAINLIAIKLPVLACDFFLLLGLLSISQAQRNRLVWFWWLNPIVIYVGYIFGQLDVVAMTFCIWSLAVLIRRQDTRNIAGSALLFALATLCKFHVAAVVPFILVYVWNRNFAREAASKISLWAGLWLAVSLVGFLPLAFAGRFSYATTTSPEAQRIFALSIQFASGTVLYPIVFVVAAVLGRLCLSTRITERGLLYGCGLVFGSLVLLTEEFPGWHLWVMPFLSLFFATYSSLPKSLWAAFVATYFIHFVGFGPYGFFSSSAQMALYKNIASTLLDLSFFGILVVLWRMGIRTEAMLYGRAKPALVGVAGDSGAGKNYFSHLCEDIFNPKNTVLLEGDNYHKWERGNDKWQEYTHLNPRANNLLTMASHTQMLSKGLPIQHSQYNHETGFFTTPRELRPTKTVVVQGLHTFYLRGMRRQFDLKVFLKPDERVRAYWKLRRDVNERSYPVETVLKNLDAREADARAHITPQKNYSDWVIEYYPVQSLSREEAVSKAQKGEEPELAVRHYLWNDAPVGKLVSELAGLDKCEAFYEDPEDADAFDRVTFCFRGRPTAQQIGRIAEKCFVNLRHITRGARPPQWRDGYDGVTQLIFLAMLEARLTEHEKALH